MALTFPAIICPELTTSRGIKGRTLTIQFGNGYKQTCNYGLNNLINTWTIKTKPLNVNESQTLDTFIKTVGAGDWWFWNPPGTVLVLKWSFLPDGININEIATDFKVYTMNIVQRFDIGS